MILFWPVVIPFLTAVLCLLAWKSTEMQKGISLAGALALFGSALMIFTEVATNGPFAAQAGSWAPPFGITMVADMLSAIMMLLVGFVAVCVVMFSFSDISNEEIHFGHHTLTHALFAGISGAFLTGDIFNMYVWFEVMLIASFGLLVVGGGREQFDGAVKYVGLNLIATVAFIAGVGLLYGATGALNMADLHAKLAGRSSEAAILASAAFLLFAFGSKAALFPVFFWLPASYHTPSFSTSALFSALLTKVGVYALIRVFTLVYDIDGTLMQPILIWGAVLTMLFGALGSLSQNSVRRVLGYSIITSIGFMIFGLGLGTPLAITAGAFYLFQDVLVKANLFLMAGATARLTGSELFARSGGMWRAHPALSLLFLIPALSLAGVPPFSGFWGKFLLVTAALEVNGYFLTFAILATGFLTLFAMGRVWAAVYWTPHPSGPRAITGSLGPSTLVPILALTIMIVAIGIDANTYVELATTVGAQITDPTGYITAVLGGAE